MKKKYSYFIFYIYKLKGMENKEFRGITEITIDFWIESVSDLNNIKSEILKSSREMADLDIINFKFMKAIHETE